MLKLTVHKLKKIILVWLFKQITLGGEDRSDLEITNDNESDDSIIEDDESDDDDLNEIPTVNNVEIELKELR